MNIGIIGYGVVGRAINHTLSREYKIVKYDKYAEYYLSPTHLKPPPTVAREYASASGVCRCQQQSSAISAPTASSDRCSAPSRAPRQSFSRLVTATATRASFRRASTCRPPSRAGAPATPSRRPSRRHAASVGDLEVKHHRVVHFETRNNASEQPY